MNPSRNSCRPRSKISSMVLPVSSWSASRISSCAGPSCPCSRASAARFSRSADVAERQAAREAAVEDHELGDRARVHPPGVEPAVGALARQRAQHVVPLRGVERGADVGQRRQQQVVLHVEDARGVVGPLEERAGAGEAVDLVAQHRAVGRAARERRFAADRGEHLAEAGRRAPGGRAGRAASSSLR